MYLPGGVPAGVCVPVGGVYLQGGVYLPGGVYLLGGVPVGGVPDGGSVSQHALGADNPPPLWTEFLTHASENITFPQLRLRTVEKVTI